GLAQDQLRIEDARDTKEHHHPSLSDFQEKCPPGGRDTVIFYTTSLTGIRRTFEDCNAVRFLLRSFKINFHERDVSLHLKYREELRKILGQGVIPPKLFVRGRYIGGADEVLPLHEQGSLRKLFEGIPLDLSKSTCVQCANVRFVICLACHGSRRVVRDNEEEPWIRCPECNENGLI
ncbi:Glutaredoxin domain-containing protein, partial [Psidium guajava]